MIRFFVYSSLIFLAFYTHHVQRALQRRIDRVEFQYLMDSVDAKLRVNAVQLRLLERQLQEDFKDLDIVVRRTVKEKADQERLLDELNIFNQ